MSCYEVNQMMEDKYIEGPELKPYLSQFGSPTADGNKIMREVVLTSQEGKIYYLTMYQYFTDLAELEQEFQEKGNFEHYCQMREGMTEEDCQVIQEIVKIKIRPR